MQEEGSDRPLRVCYFGTYRTTYGRNQIMIAGLRAQGVDVQECQVTLWRGIDDRVTQVTAGWGSPRFWIRVATTYWRLLRKHARMPTYDVMVIGYPGPFDAYLGRLLAWWRRRPMVLDHYMSLYLIAEERRLVAPRSLKGRLLRWLEGIGLRLPDMIVSDTRAYIAYHRQTYGLAPERFQLVPAGADDRLFYPRPELEPPADRFRVIYHGTFIPNHGVLTMVQAAALLEEHKKIRFDFYGDGPEREAAERLAQKGDLKNLQFHGWAAKEELPLQMAQSHVCLGVFGTTPQSLMTVQNKIWEAAAMGCPLISGDSPTIREAFTHRESIYLVERDNPRALADAVLELASDPLLREKIGQLAYERARSNTITGIGRVYLQSLSAVLTEDKRS